MAIEKSPVRRKQWQRIAAMLLTLSLVAGCAPKDATHESFSSAEEAVDAFVAALEADDVEVLEKLLGPGSEDILSTGDPIADRASRQRFLEAYRLKHALVPDSDGRTLVQLGANDWPFPVPVVQRDGRWLLDGAEGVQELLFRNVGRNELGAIAVCRGFVAAQEDYATEGHDENPAGIYATKLVSDPGQHNGLYWKTDEGEPPSPAGPFVASAAAEGYGGRASGERRPYHGYFYRMLYAQGPNAPGGAREFFVDGVLSGGYAAIAWPAEYGASGVKTFVVNQDGVIYEKDLGDETASLAEAIDVFDPDGSWTKVQESQDELDAEKLIEQEDEDAGT